MLCMLRFPANDYDIRERSSNKIIANGCGACPASRYKSVSLNKHGRLTKHAKTKIDGDDNKASVSGQGGSVKWISGAPRIGIAVNKEESR